MGDFEYALMYYHRGHKLRPELDEFRLGIQKAQEAIDNSINGDTVLVQPGLYIENLNINKDISKATNKDGIIIGLIQGFSIIPGMSRSGLTITALLLRGFNKTESLNISFLLGIPVTLVAGVTGLIYLTEILFIDILAIIISFLIGYLSIKFFITIANKIEFYSFVIFLGLMVLVSSGIYLLIA